MNLSRRDVLALSAASLLGHQFTSPAAARVARTDAAPAVTATPARKFKKAVKYGMVGAGKTVLEKFTILKDCGFDGVELDSPCELGRDEVLAAKEKSGLSIPGVVDSVHWGKPFSDPDPAVRAEGRKALETALRDAKAYGGTSVLVVPAVITKQVGFQDAWTRSQAEIKQLLPLAAELQVHILIENVWNKFLLGATELARYIDELDSPWTGSHFDAGNLVHFGYPEHWVPILGKRIKKVDVKEFKRGRAGYEGFDVKLNDGDTDWPAVVKALKAVGYDGWFTAEMSGGDAAYLTDLGKRMDAFLSA